MEDKKYYEVRKRYLSEALSFLGFHYMKFQDENNKTIYSFIDDENFQFALSALTVLKNELRNKISQ